MAHLFRILSTCIDISHCLISSSQSGREKQRPAEKTKLIAVYKNRQFMNESVTESGIQASSFVAITYSPSASAGHLKNDKKNHSKYDSRRSEVLRSVTTDVSGI